VQSDDVTEPQVTNPGGNNPGGESVENVYDQVDEVRCRGLIYTEHLASSLGVFTGV
jgi:hypothetical protein